MITRLACLLVILAVCGPASAQEKGPGVVRIVPKDGGYELQRDGKPYLIKGAGGTTHLKSAAAAGANSVRTWGADKLGPILDEAQQLGLSVAVGIWLGHERHGFNYNDANQVAKQLEMAKDVITKYKDHPAVLLWGIGNEMEGYAKGDNAAVWSAVNNIASIAKKLDPNHPTMTVVAEIGGDRVKNINRLCPDIDIVGINTYAGGATIPKRYRVAGGTKPYVLTEFGPAGMWEVTKKPWGSAPEPTSTEKAEAYRKTYEEAVLGSGGLCLGSYAFLWGNKQEATATWFGMLLPDGSRLAAADTMTELWTGKAPANRVPVIKSLTHEGPEQVEPKTTIRAKLDASDPEGDKLDVKWILQSDPATFGEGGDKEEVPPTHPDAILKADAAGAEVKLPASGGGYRLFAFVRDGKGGAAVANIPLFVKGPIVLPTAKQATLPLVVYDEATREQPAYVPTGWMGNHKALKVDEANTTKPHTGKTCLRADYDAKDAWVGVVWQHPGNNWGDRPGGWDLKGAKHLTFWARGEEGGEVVTFEFGIVAKDKRFADTGRGKLDKVTLDKDWRQYTIDVAGQDLSRIVTGFVFVVAGQGRPVTFYLDDIAFE